MRAIILGIISIFVFMRISEAQECEAILRDGIFRTDQISQNSTTSDEFRKAICSASDQGSLRSSNFGMSVPIFGEALRSIGFNSSQNSLRQWQRQNCSEDERNTQSASTYSRLIRTADQALVSAWEKCIDRRYLLDATGLVCRFNEVDGTDGGTFNFLVTWRASDMTNAGTVPVISGIHSSNLECAPDLASRKVGPGGLATVCNRPAKAEAATVVLELDIGGAPCVRSIPAVVTVSDRFKALELKKERGSTLKNGESAALSCLSGARDRTTQLAEAQRKLALIDICEKHALAGDKEKADVCINALVPSSAQPFGQRLLQYRINWGQLVAMGERWVISGYPVEVNPIKDLDKDPKPTPEKICSVLLAD